MDRPLFRKTILFLLFMVLICQNSFAARKYEFSPHTGRLDAVGVNTSADVTLVCDSGNSLTTTGSGTWACVSGSGGAPTDADYLVGTANGSLSAEIVVGTSPGGELGGTWASPTIDDSVAVTSWNLTTPTITTSATVTDTTWIGLGAASGRVAFSDTTVDEVQFLNSRAVIKNTSFPQLQFHDGTATRGYAYYDTTNNLMALNRTGNVLSGLSIDASDHVRIGGGASVNELRFLEPSGSGTNYTAFKVGAQAANITYTLPNAIGGPGTVLSDTLGDGGLAWAAITDNAANRQLSNLLTVAINTSLVSDTDSTDDLGSTARAWANLYIDTIRSITGNPLALTPVSGQSLTVNLATTGDFVVNTSQLYVDTSAARVGVNTTVPENALDINSSTGANLQLTYNDSDGSAANKVNFAVSAAGDLTITPSGGDTSFTGNIIVGTAALIPTVIGGLATTSDLVLQTTTGVGTTGADMHFLVGNNGATEAMTILNSGLVGIGNNTTPAAALDVLGTIGLQIRASDTNADVTNKNFYLTARSYTNSNEDVCIFITADTSTINVLGLGGGSGVLNAMTRVRIYTGAGVDTLTGTSAVNVDENGFTAFGKGTTVATTVVDIQGADNAVASTVRINATQANCTTSDTFTDYRSTSGSEGSVACTAVGGVIAYNTFTGSHYTQISNKTGILPGMLLEMVDGEIDWQTVDNLVTQTSTIGDDNQDEADTGKQKTITKQVRITETPNGKGHLPRSEICATRASKKVYGAYGGTNTMGQDLVLSIGTGVLFVINTGSDIDQGDYLMSSATPGHGELQVDDTGKKDDVYRNITVAKSSENVVWQVSETARLVNVIYEGG